MKLSSEERKELEKYAKHLALKSTQVIVQSRLGEKFITDNYAEPISASWSWFNLNIKDVPEIYAETKRVLNGKILSARLPLCIEISLRTTKGDQMVLETWCLGLSPEKCEPTAKIVKKVYKRIHFLLKSLLTITRVLPAYKLSRMQGPLSYVICYRLYMGEPLEQSLGEDYRHVQVDEICTPMGTFHLSVSYRTKLTISPTKTEQNDYILKSDEINRNLEPRVEKGDDAENDDDFNKPTEPGSCVNPLQVKTSADFQHLLKQNIPLERILPENKHEERNNTELVDKESEEIVEGLLESEMGALTMDTSTDTSGDYFMVPTHLPFAQKTDAAELGDFIRGWNSAPALEAFTDVSPPDASEVAKQLELFELVSTEYNELVELLHKLPSESPDSK